jgi:hypothetical protein
MMHIQNTCPLVVHVMQPAKTEYRREVEGGKKFGTLCL